MSQTDVPTPSSSPTEPASVPVREIAAPSPLNIQPINIRCEPGTSTEDCAAQATWAGTEATEYIWKWTKYDTLTDVLAGAILVVAAIFAFKTFQQTRRQAKAQEDQVEKLEQQRADQKTATDLQLFELRRQADAAEAQRDDARATSKAQIDAANRQAISAEQQLELSSKAARDEARARAAAIRPQIKVSHFSIKPETGMSDFMLKFSISTNSDFYVRDLQSQLDLSLLDLNSLKELKYSNIDTPFDNDVHGIIRGGDDLTDFSIGYNVDKEEWDALAWTEALFGLKLILKWTDSLDWRITETFIFSGEVDTTKRVFNLKSLNLESYEDTAPVPTG